MTAQCPAGDTDPEDSKTVNHPFPHPSAHALDVRAIHFLAHYCCNSLDKNISFYFISKSALSYSLKTVKCVKVIY